MVDISDTESDSQGGVRESRRVVLPQPPTAKDVADWLDIYIPDIWLIGILAGFLSSIVDSFTIAISNLSLYSVGAGGVMTNGAYWSIIAYTTAVGGCLLSVGSVCGLALMRAEHVSLGWYIKHMTPKVLLGFLLGYIVLWLEVNMMAL